MRAAASEAVEDARAFGFTDEQIAALEASIQASEAGDEIELWADNKDIVAAFMAVSTQWRVGSLPMGGLHYIGLDYSGARAGLELAGIAATPGLWEGVRVMEREATHSLNSR